MHDTRLAAGSMVAVWALMLAIGCAGDRASAAEGPAPFLMAPHVCFVDTESARLAWVSEPGVEPGTVAVKGDGAGAPVRAEAHPIGDRPELIHVAALKGLRPGTRYDYTVKCGSASAEGSFTTGPSPGKPFRFVVYGDTRSRPDKHREVAEAIAKEDPDFVVHTGDLVARGEDWGLWEKEFFGPAQPFLRECAFWPVRGNHEMDAVLFKELFVLPNSGLYYSFDWGSAHFVMLDNYQRGEARQAMLDWMKSDLATQKGEWVFLVDHEPTFNVGGHASKWGRDDFLPAMYEGGLDVALAGHSHLYERFLPIRRGGGKPITFIVTGGGGAPTYPVVPSPILAGGIGDSVVHYCLFEIDGNRLKMTVKRADGSIIDHLELVKTGDAYQPEVMEQAVDYDEAVALQFVFANMKVELPALPAPGQAVEALLSASGLPEGSVLTVGPAAEAGEWTVPQQTLERTEGGYRIRLKAPDEKLAADSAGFRPPLRLRLTFRGEGLGSSSADLALAPGPETVKRLNPAPQPVAVRRAPVPVVVDGDLAEWAKVSPLPNPFHNEPTGPFRFCWTEQGLFGAVAVTDDSIEANPEAPWQADGVEVFVDKAFARAGSIDAGTGQYGFSPAPERGPGQAHFVIAHGANRSKPTQIACAWRPVSGGYTLEFLLPAQVLEPAAMRAGTVIGLNVVLDNAGRPVRQFYCDKGNDGWRTPLRWGAIRLAE